MTITQDEVETLMHTLIDTDDIEGAVLFMTPEQRTAVRANALEFLSDPYSDEADVAFYLEVVEATGQNVAEWVN
jgi:hypothetical protein